MLNILHPTDSVFVYSEFDAKKNNDGFLLQEWCLSFDVHAAMLPRWSVKNSTRSCVRTCVIHEAVCL